jgi:hypothetical protein
MVAILHEEKTGHQYYGTHMAIYESTDNCGTCDGARCDRCKTKYIVEDYDNAKLLYSGFDKAKAEEIYTQNNAT